MREASLADAEAKGRIGDGEYTMSPPAPTELADSPTATVAVPTAALCARAGAA